MSPVERGPNELAAASRTNLKLLGAFSIGNNLARLTSVSTSGRANKTYESSLGQLDLLRSLSSVWIIVSHSYFFALAWLKFEPGTTSSVYKSPLEQILPGATFAVDSFFLLSGLLASYKRQQRLRGRRAAAANPNESSATNQPSFKQVLSSICLRYLRLVPVMMSLMALSVLVLPHLCGSEQVERSCPNLAQASVMFVAWCKPQWSLNLLMVQNFFGTQEMCMSHSWFVAVEFQLFTVTTLVIWLCSKVTLNQLKRRRPANDWRPFALLIIVVQLVNSLLVYVNDLPAMPLVAGRGVDKQQQLAKENDYYRLLYIKPYHWLSSYLMGMALAGSGRRARQFLAGWPAQKRRLLVALNLFCLLALILSNWPFRSQAIPMSRQYAAFYTLLARPFWSLNIASLLVLSSIGMKLNKTLARFLAAMSHLTYSAYLSHPILMAAFYGTRRELFSFSHSLLLYFTLAHLVITHLFALFVYLLIELPIKTILADHLDERRRGDNETMRRLSNRQLKR